jgi:hypothetical protein
MVFALHNHPDFYKSIEWRKLRKVALRLYGNMCHHCGMVGTTQKRLHVDHIKPKSLFSNLCLEITNLQILCEECNTHKSNKYFTDYRPKEHRTYAEIYKTSPHLLKSIVLERVHGVLNDDELTRRNEQRKKDKQQNPESKPIDKRLQSKFLIDIRSLKKKKDNDDSIKKVLDLYVRTYGEKKVRDLIKLCRLDYTCPFR